MSENRDLPPPTPLRPLDQWLVEARDRTPARVFQGRAGTGYLTATQLELRADHAAAVDAVQAELDLHRDLGPECVDRFSLFEVNTRASSRQEYLIRPDLGRQLDEEARERIRARCPHQTDLQVVIGDGLSVAAVRRQVPELLPRLEQLVRQGAWSWGQPFVVRNCRVGVLNDIGDVLQPEVVVLLIGERPGLATAESLSAYLAFRPRPGHTDAHRNLISNIHARGVTADEAAQRILAFAQLLRSAGKSGVEIKEERPGAGRPQSSHLAPPR